MRTNHQTTAFQTPFFLHDSADLVGKSLPHYTLTPLSLRSGQLCISAEHYMKLRTMPLWNEVLKANLYPIIISQMEVNHV